MILFVLSVSTILLVGCQAAPANYDQRQDGSLNVNADLENFLLVFVTKGSIINDLALIDFKSMAKQMTGHQDNKDGIGDNVEPIMSLEGEDVGERSKTGKPYQVDIVRIPKDKERSNDVDEKEQREQQSLESKLKKVQDESSQDSKYSESPTKGSEPSLKQEDERTLTSSVDATTVKSKLQDETLQSDRSKIDSNA